MSATPATSVSAPVDEPATLRQPSTGRFCVFLAVAATMATGQLFGLIPLLPHIAGQWGSSTRAGLPLFAAGYATGMLVLGSLALRVGARQMLALSLVIGGLLVLISAVTVNAPTFLSVRLAEGFALGGFPPAAFVATNQRVQPQRRLLANSAMVFGLLGSAGVAGLVSRSLVGPLGWRGTLAVNGAVVVVLGVTAYRLAHLAPGDPTITRPYRPLRAEATSAAGLQAEVSGAAVMATFVTFNGLTQQGPHPVLALALVLLTVLVLLSSARGLQRINLGTRRGLGLASVIVGLGGWLLAPSAILGWLVLVTAGATLVVPACIQSVVSAAKASVPAAVSCFTSCLFIGGGLAGLAVTGLVPVSARAVGGICLVLLLALAVAGARSMAPRKGVDA